MSPVQPPPNKNPVIGANSIVDPHWLDFFIALNTGTAPVNGPYLITEANSSLTGAFDLGLLTTGYLRIAVAAGIASPSSVATIPGTDVTHSVVSKTFADTGYVALKDQTVLVDATGGVTTIKLPATPTSGSFVIVKKTDASGNAVTVDANGVSLDGAGTKNLAAQWNAFTMQFSGANWFITGSI